MGASNARRTADALEQLGVSVLRAVIPGWRGLKMKVQYMVDLVRSKLKEAGPTALLYTSCWTTAFTLLRRRKVDSSQLSERPLVVNITSREN